jgi:hypothetical protein
MAAVIIAMKPKSMRGVSQVKCVGRREMHVELWWGNLKVKPPVGRPRQRLEDNSEMDFKR